jgi:TetR/AcrR family transcriptional regulator, transcriptional repressor for nem operon
VRDMNDAKELSYTAWLAHKMTAAPKRLKGERTRETLKLATAQALENAPYSAVTVVDICARAGVSNGTFYLYFKDLEMAALEVLTDFLAEPLVSPPYRAATPFESILQSNLAWIAAMKANAGLFRCVLQVADSVPQIAELASTVNRRWYERVVERLSGGLPYRSGERAALLLAVYGLGAMMDELGRKLVTSPDARFRTLVAEVAPDDAALAELLSLIWYRAIFGCDPDDALRHKAARALSESTAVKGRQRRASGKPARTKKN